MVRTGQKSTKVGRRFSLKPFTIGDCWMQSSHKLNQDEYFRKRYSEGFIMFHRLMWQHTHDMEVPEGHEVDHLCCNRACFNPKHLQLVTKAEHVDKSNRQMSRYKTGLRYKNGRRKEDKYQPEEFKRKKKDEDTEED